MISMCFIRLFLWAFVCSVTLGNDNGLSRSVEHNANNAHSSSNTHLSSSSSNTNISSPTAGKSSVSPVPNNLSKKVPSVKPPEVSKSAAPAFNSSASSTTASSSPKINNTSNVYINASFQRINSGALLRGFYVFVGLSVIVVMYIVVRAVRLRRKVSRVHKYGILASREDVEMTPLGAEDEDDDTIVFDLSNHPST